MISSPPYPEEGSENNGLGAAAKASEPALVNQAATRLGRSGFDQAQWLAERVEALGGPDRSIDALIAVAIDLDARGVTDDDHEYLSPVRKDDYAVRPGAYWFCSRSGRSLRMAPEYTTSLDLAESLVPKGMEFGCGSRDDTCSAWAWAGEDHRTASLSNAATPELALIAAALRARGSL